ncbi:MAG: site-specific tyrosine recombinase XerD [Clostridiales bacterium]|nr:site-specific tyrosine recombinase XerD [Clostridiales bacterium]
MDHQIERFLEYLSTEKDAAENTLSSYRRDLMQFCAFLQNGGVTAWENVTKTHVLTYIYELKKLGRAGTTISRNMASLRVFFQYLQNHGVVCINPTAEIVFPKIEKKAPEILTMQEVEELLLSPSGKDPKAKRDKALLELLYATGMRVTEVVSLKMSDLNLDLGSVKCSTREHTRVIPLGSQAIQALRDYIEEGRTSMVRQGGEPWLFVNYCGQKMSRQGIWKIIKYYAEKTGITINITPNVLRHSFATHLLENGADIQVVQEFLGHADVSATLVYQKIKRNRLRDVYLSTHPRA